MNRVHDYRDVEKNSLFLLFQASFVGSNAVSWGSRVDFLMFFEPCAQLSRRHENSVFLSFRASFVGYNAPFWGHGSAIDGP